MKNPINLFLIVLILGLVGWNVYKSTGGSGGSSSSVLPEGYDAAGSTVFDVDGTDTKLIEERDANGILKETGAMLNGLKTGTWTTYHPDQRIKRIASYVGGKLNGPYLELNNRGMIELEATYKDGEYDGLYAKFKSGSRKMEERRYLNGKLHGIYRKYDERKNKVQQEIHYKNGVQHGPLRYFDEEGNVTMEYNYNNGEKVSGGIVPATKAAE